ncbi:hypothetical protein LCGC14_2068850, partial [marine sediment metagenome]
GTDWGIYGDTPEEQWRGLWLEAEIEDEIYQDYEDAYLHE